jgi:hypothetical protein
MGADKNFSPKRELGLCPKFTTKDSHTSLPRSRSHNGPTNHRNKPQTIPKRKHDSRSEGLSCPAVHQVDCPRPPGGPSARVWWTVRGLRRTVRKNIPAHQYCTLSNRPSAMGPGTSAPSRIRWHFSTNCPRTPCNKNPSTQWIEQKTLKNWWRTLGMLGSSRTVRQEKFLQPELNPLKVNSTFPLLDLPNQPSDCYKIIGEYEESLGDAIPTNL